MHPLKGKDPGVHVAGVQKSECLVGNSNASYSTPALDVEAYAAIYVARRFRLSPSMARAVVALAGIGRALG